MVHTWCLDCQLCTQSFESRWHAQFVEQTLNIVVRTVLILTSLPTNYICCTHQKCVVSRGLNGLVVHLSKSPSKLVRNQYGE